MLARLSPVIKLRTLILTQVSLPLVQLWTGKLELEAFQSTLRIQNVQFGVLGNGAMPDSRLPQQNFSGRVAFGPSLRRQSEISFWQGRPDATPDAGMEVCAAMVAALLN